MEETQRFEQKCAQRNGPGQGQKGPVGAQIGVVESRQARRRPAQSPGNGQRNQQPGGADGPGQGSRRSRAKGHFDDVLALWHEDDDRPLWLGQFGDRWFAIDSHVPAGKIELIESQPKLLGGGNVVAGAQWLDSLGHHYGTIGHRFVVHAVGRQPQSNGIDHLQAARRQHFDRRWDVVGRRRRAQPAAAVLDLRHAQRVHLAKRRPRCGLAQGQSEEHGGGEGDEIRGKRYEMRVAGWRRGAGEQGSGGAGE